MALRGHPSLYSRTLRFPARRFIKPVKTYLGLGYSQVLTDLSHELFLNLAMSGNGALGVRVQIAINGVLPAFTNEDAPFRCEVPYEVGAFHLIEMFLSRQD